uniref:Forkhead box J3 n=1 Tax=Hippocampus comes TaxID=109280 RepID=A0A3Q2YFB5_HIPCM
IMRQAELNNWSLDASQIADLCSSVNQFFTATGVIPAQAQPHGAMQPKASQHNQHGNMYMDSRQNVPSLMGPPGYPHMPPISSTAPTMTQQQRRQHMLPPGHFQVRRMLASDDIQDDFDWDSIV